MDFRLIDLAAMVFTTILKERPDMKPEDALEAALKVVERLKGV